jgi:hypothetical protein
MNSKIQQLARQAGAEDYPTRGVTCLYGDHEIEKFAQLIIAECISACATSTLGKTQSAESLIQKHLGIFRENP